MNKTQYPKRIKVGKSHYKIELVPFIEEIEGNVTRGYCETKQKLITLLSAQTHKEVFSTFIHELLHAIEAEHKVKLRHSKVYALEAALAQVLTDNFTIRPKRR